MTSADFRNRSTLGLLPLSEIVPIPITCSVRNVSQHFPTQIFSSGSASAVNNVSITAAQLSRYSYDLHPGSFSDNAQFVKGAPPATLLCLTPHSEETGTKVPVAAKDAASNFTLNITCRTVKNNSSRVRKVTVVSPAQVRATFIKFTRLNIRSLKSKSLFWFAIK